MKTFIGLALTANIMAAFTGNTVSYIAADDTTSVSATVTAYTSSADETDDTPNVTASGSVTAPGTLACPPKYKFGTRVEIEGSAYVCNDRMNSRYADEERFDVWMNTKSEAKKWGKRLVTVKILGI